MMLAKEAAALTKDRAAKKQVEALNEFQGKEFEAVRIFIAEKIQLSIGLGGDSISVYESELRQRYKNITKLHRMLREMGYTVEGSLSTNPNNERWTITW